MAIKQAGWEITWMSVFHNLCVKFFILLWKFIIYHTLKFGWNCYHRGNTAWRSCIRKRNPTKWWSPLMLKQIILATCGYTYKKFALLCISSPLLTYFPFKLHICYHRLCSLDLRAEFPLVCWVHKSLNIFNLLSILLGILLLFNCKPTFTNEIFLHDFNFVFSKKPSSNNFS